MKQQLAGEPDEREIAVLLVGAGTHAGLERMNEFLARFGVPISVVSFEVFELEGGPRLLIREVVDEPTKPILKNAATPLRRSVAWLARSEFASNSITLSRCQSRRVWLYSRNGHL